jgi:sugar lactone lactonase YvrE
MNSRRHARGRINVTRAVAIVAAGALTAACQGLGTNSPTSTVTITPTGAPSSGAMTQSTPTSSQTTQSATSSGQTTQSGQPSSSAAPTGNAVVVPFTGLAGPIGITIGQGGDVADAIYVTDSGNNRVVSLAANSETQTVAQFSSLSNPQGVAVDSAGNIYVTDANGNRLLWAKPPQKSAAPPWQASSSTEWAGPFSGLQNPRGAIMYAQNNWFVVDGGNNRVVKWSTGTNAPEVIPFTGLNNPDGAAMVNTGQYVVYVADTGNNRVLRQAAESTSPQTLLPFTGLNNPHGVTVDNDGNIFVTDSGNNRVLKLAADHSAPTGLSTTPTILPFTGLNNPQGVASDSQGNVYVVDSGNNRVLKLDKSFT